MITLLEDYKRRLAIPDHSNVNLTPQKHFYYNGL